MFTRTVTAALLCSALCGTGCTHNYLRWNTVQQSTTVAEIHQQQVLKNLAVFASNYNALPSFSFPNQGGSNVTDQANAGMTPALGIPSGASSLKLNAFGFSFGAQRQAQESFTMTPINDPRKLELMRCAYQKALSSCGYGPPSETCPDCKTLFNKFYTGDPNGDIREKANGTVTSECLNLTQPWFCVGCKKDVPKDCCTYVGEHCGVYVWVPPEGRGELSKLTLAILDYANNAPPAGLTKTVLYYIDEYGVPTSPSQAVGQVTAAIAIDEQPASLLNTSEENELRIEQTIKSRLKLVNERIYQLRQYYPELVSDDFDSSDSKASPTSDDKEGKTTAKNAKPRVSRAVTEEYKRLLDQRLALQNKLEYLNEQLRTPGLNERFFPIGTQPSQDNPLLRLNQMQNILTPR